MAEPQTPEEPIRVDARSWTGDVDESLTGEELRQAYDTAPSHAQGAYILAGFANGERLKAIKGLVLVVSVGIFAAILAAVRLALTAPAVYQRLGPGPALVRAGIAALLLAAVPLAATACWRILNPAVEKFEQQRRGGWDRLREASRRSRKPMP